MNAQAQERAGRAQAGMLEQNARFADLQSADALDLGRQEEFRSRRQYRSLVGSQRAALAASGVQVDSGSAAEIQTDSATIGEEEALRIRNNAARAAWGYRVQAGDYRNQARLARRGGRNAAVASLLSLGGDLYQANGNYQTRQGMYAADRAGATNGRAVEP